MQKTSDNPLAAIASKFINSTNRHVFLTGKAGTGKTTFLRNIKSYTHKNVIVAAPTGIAAINAGGVTLHSLFQLPFGSYIPSNTINEDEINIQLTTPKSLLKSFQMHKTKRSMLMEMELLIIDEVSMLRADLLDAIDTILRHVRRIKYLPFGGVQILFIGDLLQLPPVVKEEEKQYLAQWYDGFFFFNAKALQNNKPVYIELDKIYRQSDPVFINLLNNLRDNKLQPNDISLLNKYYKPNFEPKKNDGYINLVTHNRLADEINTRELNKIPGETFEYEAEIMQEFPEHQYPIEYTLKLKKGAQVMFIKNDYSGEQLYYNGKIGTVKSLSKSCITVSFNDGSASCEVERYSWENKRFTLNKDTNEIEEKLIGTFSHYPIKLAWAITVHKSQGLTFDKAIIDVSRAFASGQIYVALSRLTSLEGLVLTAPVPSSGIQKDDDLIDFEQNKQAPEELGKVIKNETRIFVIDSCLKAFNLNDTAKQLEYHCFSYDKDEKRSAKQKYKAWAIELKNEFKAIHDVSDKFLVQIRNISLIKDDTALSQLGERLNKAKGYFEPLLKGFSKKVLELIAALGKTKGTKAYISELREVEHLFYKQLQYIIKAEALLKSALDNTELVKETLKTVKGDDKRLEELKETSEKAKKKPKKPKEQQESTKDISFKLFKDGKNTHEIAEERNLTVNTIEGHLAHFVALGKIDISELMDKKKAQKAIETAKKIDSFSLSAVKERLGKEFSYGELKMAMAWRIFLLSKED